MSNHERQSDTGNRQLFPNSELFPASLDFDLVVRRALSFALRKSTKSRQQIAEQMSLLMNTEVSVPTLDAFTAESKRGHRFPAAWLPAFCFVTGDTYLLRRMAERIGGVHLVNEEDMEMIELGRQFYVQTRSQRIIGDLMQKISRREER